MLDRRPAARGGRHPERRAGRAVDGRARSARSSPAAAGCWSRSANARHGRRRHRRPAADSFRRRRPRRSIARRGRPARLGALEYGHPIFEPFRAPRSGDFSSARASTAIARRCRHRTRRSLARFDDGAPALVERRVGNGRVLMWTSTLDLQWNDLPLKSVFLPFVHRMATTLAAYSRHARRGSRSATCSSRRARRRCRARRRTAPARDGADALGPARDARRRRAGRPRARRAGLLRSSRRRAAKRHPS